MQLPSAQWLDPLRHPLVGSLLLAAATALALWLLPRPMAMIVAALIVTLVGGLLLGVSLAGVNADPRLDGPAALAWLLLALGGVYLTPWLLVVALLGQMLWALARYRRWVSDNGISGRYVLAGTAYPLLIALTLIWRLDLITSAAPAV